MACKLYRVAVSIVILLGAAPASAIPFYSYDARSMAMGGAGVAVAGTEAAALFNPALLSIAQYDDDFTLLLPSVGVRLADPKDLIGTVMRLIDGALIDNLTKSIESLNLVIATAKTTPTADNVAAVGNNAATVADNLTQLILEIETMSNKPLTFDGHLASVMGIPNKKFGIAFLATTTILASASFQYNDAEQLTALTSTVACLSRAAVVTPVANAKTAIEACKVPDFSNATLKSTITIWGALLIEAGFAVSRELYINRQRISLGITPKIVQARIYEIPIGLKMPSKEPDDYKAIYNMLNFDFGIAKNHRNRWRSGLVIKNVIPYYLEFKNAPVAGLTPVATGTTLRLFPQTRAGVSYTTRRTTLALDADLYRNVPVGLENATQHISLGGELNAWNFAQLRAGYRVDVVTTARNIMSLGLGLSPFGVHVDLAVYTNSIIINNIREVGGFLQLGFRF